MFGRRKTQPEASPPPVERPGAKNRPTPKRSDVEAARKRPLVPADRKVAAKAAREQARQDRVRAREAMLTGDDRYLPPRDKGPVKRYVRDFVDARWNAGEWFLIVALVVVALSLTRSATTQVASYAVLWAMILFCLVDGFLLSRQLKRRIRGKFGDEGLAGGAVRYGVLRAFQLRRVRLPKPTVKRGQYPR
ncbi:MAG: DUF3043 domain-containing protein [Actinomycetes bacterium]